ncbi:MAG: tetratricopeptide repeat protein [Candidatus Omnitrophica bacterium]|nr:tetratricopeptide repeat protein [Candidatus Omnitrophota bacterium]
MQKINFEKERMLLDRDITFFHFNRAKRRIIKCLEVAKKTNNDFYLFYFLAQKYILDEKYFLAIKYLDKALFINENDEFIYNDKALCFADLGKYKEALECFDRGIKKARDSSLLYHNKGWLFNLLGRHKEAILCFKKALELDKQRLESLYSMADSYEKINDIENAYKYFKKTLVKLKGKCSFMYNKTKRRLKKLKSLI